MKVHKTMWVDPPAGWMYGFPKLYTPEVDGDLYTWLVDNGYPADHVDPSTLVRFWDAEDES